MARKSLQEWQKGCPIGGERSVVFISDFAQNDRAKSELDK